MKPFTKCLALVMGLLFTALTVQMASAAAPVFLGTTADYITNRGPEVVVVVSNNGAIYITRGDRYIFMRSILASNFPSGGGHGPIKAGDFYTTIGPGTTVNLLQPLFATAAMTGGTATNEIAAISGIANQTGGRTLVTEGIGAVVTVSDGFTVEARGYNSLVTISTNVGTALGGRYAVSQTGGFITNDLYGLLFDLLQSTGRAASSVIGAQAQVTVGGTNPVVAGIFVIENVTAGAVQFLYGQKITVNVDPSATVGVSYGMLIEGPTGGANANALVVTSRKADGYGLVINGATAQSQRVLAAFNNGGLLLFAVGADGSATIQSNLVFNGATITAQAPSWLAPVTTTNAIKFIGGSDKSGHAFNGGITLGSQGEHARFMYDYLQGITTIDATWLSDGATIQLNARSDRTNVVISATGDTTINGGLTITNTGNGLKIGAGNAALTNLLSVTAVLDFPSIVAGTVADLPVAFAGAADGDVVTLGVPLASVTNCTWMAFASNAVVYVRAANGQLVTEQDPGSGTFRIVLQKYR